MQAEDLVSTQSLEQAMRRNLEFRQMTTNREAMEACEPVAVFALVQSAERWLGHALGGRCSLVIA